jgi:hypothetical protein
MATKEPVLLVVLIETAEFRWWVAGVSLAGETWPLLRSDRGNLRTYVVLPFDEQVSFLRHRMCGVLQRGSDRLWGLSKKPCQIVFIADANFPEAEPELTLRLAEHFVLWMASPAVAYFLSPSGLNSESLPPLINVAGQLSEENVSALRMGWPRLVEKMHDLANWELALSKN